MKAERETNHLLDGGFSAATALNSGRGRQRALDQSAVTEVGLRIVREHGLSGLTMRRVASELDVALATLYSVAGSKAAILNAMIESVLAELPHVEPEPGRERDALVQLWTATHEVLLAHPEVAQLAALQPIGTAGLFGLVQATLDTLDTAGVDREDAVVAYQTLRSYSLGYTLLRITRSGAGAEPEKDRRQAMSSLPPERYPLVIASADELAGPMTTDQYISGITRIVDAFIVSRRSR
ncbi:TetR/AcrR family transcriptional regulator [Nocardia neocaledoniensis]|uniref:TetR/AcrR family transcriptional regulator n=1 Tax=Nocardia neocaledoniensis TaxID=236511 RepID=UPI0024571A68|nr:TetR/AcrR family transcriptional regulator C-terminal domain-containing protein [Nocardia neocaledoniensis]